MNASMTSQRAGLARIAATISFASLIAFAPGSHASSLPAEPPLHERGTAGGAPAIDPFLAGALGIIPFASGLYLTEQPARGILFTAVDVLMALGIYTARYTSVGEEGSVSTYFLLMGANNIADAIVSMRYATQPPPYRAMVLPLPRGGVHGAIHWNF